MALISIAGAGGSYPPPGMGGPSLVVEDGAVAVLDCGEDCLRGLSLLGLSPCDPEIVYVSHVHIDHWAGLPALAVARIAEGCPSLRILAHPGVLGSGLASALQHVLPRSLDSRIEPVESFTIGGLTAHLFPVEHTIPTYGVLLERGGRRLLAYTSDTRPSQTIASRLEGVEVLVAEATLPSGLVEVALSSGHSTVEGFLGLAKLVSPELAIAFHLSPESLKELAGRLRGGGPGRVMIAWPGTRISI